MLPTPGMSRASPQKARMRFCQLPRAFLEDRKAITPDTDTSGSQAATDCQRVPPSSTK